MWDGRRRLLFCARDPVGAVPFYYWHDGRSFRAATELCQLFADPAVPRAPNESMVAQHLADRHRGRRSGDASYLTIVGKLISFWASELTYFCRRTVTI